MSDRNPDLTAVVDHVARAARDVAYVAVGAGVLGFQRAQVHRHELNKRMAKAADATQGDAGAAGRGTLPLGLSGTVHAIDKVVDEAVEGVVAWVDSTVTPLEERLPDPARTVARQAHTLALQAHLQVREVRTQIRDRIAG